jgi:hypothetical protein
MGKFKKTMVVLASAAIVSLILGRPLLALISICYIIGLLSRYLCLTSDIVKDAECVTTCAMILTIVINPAVGAIFAFTCMWLSRFTHPNGKAERISYLIGDSICMATGALLYPFILAYTGNQLLPAMFWFHVWRFAFFFIAMMPMFNKVAWGPDIACGITGFPIAVTQAFSLIVWFGLPVLAIFEITGYSLGTVFGVGASVVTFG